MKDLIKSKLILKSYLIERAFRIKHKDAYSVLKEINAGVPRGSVLDPVLYLIYISDIPELSPDTKATIGIIS